MARPLAAINWPTVDRLLQAGCTGVQIAARLGISNETLYRATEREHKIGFDAYAADKRAHGDTLILEKQMDAAMKGDRTMLIWLGKQRLNQKDRNETTFTGADVEITIGSPIEDAPKG